MPKLITCLAFALALAATASALNLRTSADEKMVTQTTSLVDDKVKAASKGSAEDAKSLIPKVPRLLDPPPPIRPPLPTRLLGASLTHLLTLTHSLARSPILLYSSYVSYYAALAQVLPGIRAGAYMRSDLNKKKVQKQNKKQKEEAAARIAAEKAEKAKIDALKKENEQMRKGLEEIRAITQLPVDKVKAASKEPAEAPVPVGPASAQRRQAVDNSKKKVEKKDKEDAARKAEEDANDAVKEENKELRKRRNKIMGLLHTWPAPSPRS